MRAAVLYGVGDIRVEDVPVPEPGPGEVLLSVGTVGICGTDAAEFGKGPNMFPIERRHPVTGYLGPMTIGHEYSGTVESVGVGVDPAWVGKLVASCGAVSCGQCWQCQRGRTNLCVRYSSVGLHRPGALAEYVTTPIANCTSVEDLGLGPDGAALGQPMSIAVHARNRGRVQSGERVVIFGAGGIGAFLVYAVKSVGATVTVVDASEVRLQLARKLGADATLSVAEASTENLTDAAGGPPHTVLEASGRHSALESAFAVLPSGGRLVAVGIQHAPVEIDIRRLTITELEIIGTNAMVRAQDFDDALNLVAGRAVGWADVAPTVLTLEEIATEALPALAEGRSSAVKTLADPRIADRRASVTTPQHG